MAVLEFPVYRLLNVRRRLEASAAGSRSAFTAQRRVQDWGGRAWMYDVQMSVTSRADGRKLDSFFTRLNGIVNTFTFADPTARYLDGLIFPGAPVVAGAGQSGKTLTTSGWVAGVALLDGMFISVGAGTETRLHQIVGDVIVAADGTAALPIEPGLREAPASGAAIEVFHPKVHLRLTSPAPTDIGLADFYRFSFTAEEAL